MKKLLSTLLISLGMILIIPAATFAATGNTIVEGTVYTTGNVPLANAKVTITCDGTTKHATTDASGDYSVSYTAKKCPVGTTVYGSATAKVNHKNLSGSNQVPVSTTNNTALNIATDNITVSLPELGFLTATIAAALSGGAFFLIRRRNLSAQAR